LASAEGASIKKGSVSTSLVDTGHWGGRVVAKPRGQKRIANWG